MKKLFIALTLVFALAPIQSLASGKLSAEMRGYKSGQLKPVLGLGIYESFISGVGINLWTGYGDQPLHSEESAKWYTAKGAVELDMSKRVQLAIGAGTSYTFDYKVWNHYISGKLTYKLW